MILCFWVVVWWAVVLLFRFIFSKQWNEKKIYLLNIIYLYTTLYNTHNGDIRRFLKWVYRGGETLKPQGIGGCDLL